MAYTAQFARQWTLTKPVSLTAYAQVDAGKEFHIRGYWDPVERNCVVTSIKPFGAARCLLAKAKTFQDGLNYRCGVKLAEYYQEHFPNGWKDDWARDVAAAAMKVAQPNRSRPYLKPDDEFHDAMFDAALEHGPDFDPQEIAAEHCVEWPDDITIKGLLSGELAEARRAA